MKKQFKKIKQNTKEILLKETNKALEGKIIDICHSQAKEGLYSLVLSNEEGSLLNEDVKNNLVEIHGLSVVVSNSETGTVINICWS